MSRVTLLPANERKVQSWKNGGGETTEIAVYPSDAGLDNFEWRISMASVTTSGSFSHFADVDRILAVIEGRLELALDDTKTVQLTPNSPPIRFPGDVSVIGTPLDDRVVDLNLMANRSRWTGSMERIALARSETVALGSDCSVILFTGEGRIKWSEGEASVRPFDAILVEAANDETLELESSASAYLLKLFAKAP